MNKEELIAQISERSGVTRRIANVVLTQFFAIITDALRDDLRVAISGFGTFEVKVRRERMGRNPRTGEPIAIAARHVPGFIASKSLRTKIAEKSTR
ncbi:MAG: HU family DNA-binding protein [Cyanobacteria bacterium NC_groundwater_1444_Ag_S-0.65um_54_12]|nr:HU family DNA-binding protein [Cyanobacteria bacterium NC_groundwater_1444_Ag_S-0.65um_54_12]